MATKNTKSVGSILGQSKEYWQNAAKQFIWPIDFNELQILVPQKDLELAQDNLMIMHFRTAGWHVQSVIGEVEYSKPYVAPVTNGKPMFKEIKKEEQVKQSDYSLNQRFKIKSTECELKISHIERGKIHLEYTNRKRPNLISSEENLNKVLRMGTWLELKDR